MAEELADQEKARAVGNRGTGERVPQVMNVQAGHNWVYFGYHVTTLAPSVFCRVASDTLYWYTRYRDRGS